MTSTSIAASAAATVLMFWAVGSHNRLVRLGQSVAQAFAPVDVQIQRRHALLLRWLQAMPIVIEHAPQAVEAVQGAASQLQAACAALRRRPAALQPAACLRLAETTLAAARLRFLAELPVRAGALAQGEAAVLADELADADSTLAFARQAFNDASGVYNQALAEFPTRLMARLFGLRPAGLL